MIIENCFAVAITLGYSLILFTIIPPIRYAIEDWIDKTFEKYKYLFGYAWQYDDGKKDLTFLKKKGLNITPFEDFAKKCSIPYAYNEEDDAFEVNLRAGKGFSICSSRSVKVLILWPKGVKLESNQKTIKNLTGILVSENDNPSHDRFFKREQIICLDYTSAQKNEQN